MKNFKRLLSAFLAVIMCISVIPMSVFAAAENGLGNFTKRNSYNSELFTDVSESNWFYDNVKTAYELGLMVGKGENTFDTESGVTIAETITIAARIHSIYHTGDDSFEKSTPWYDAYVDYAKTNGVLKYEVSDYAKAATRAEFAVILVNALPDEALESVNKVAANAIPDVKITDAFGDAVYKLYRAGIMVGNDENGTFAPASNIKRSEVSAIVTRMADRALRRAVQLGKEYTVSFDMNGHGSQVSAQTVFEGDAAVKPADPKANNYKFKGWYTSGGELFDFSAPITGDVTLYAAWESTTNHNLWLPILGELTRTFTVKFESNGGSAVADQTVMNGKTVTMPADPTKDNYNFIGWYTDAALTEEFDPTTAVKKNITLYAKWVKITYTVSFETNGGSAVANQTVEHGKTVTKPADPTKENFTFAGWFTDEALTAEYDFTATVTKSITLYAKWDAVANGFSVTFESNGGTPVASQNVSAGGKAMLPPEPVKPGFIFTGWATSPLGGTMWNFSHYVTESMTLYAIWATVADVSLDTPDPDVEIYSFNTDVYDVLVGTSDEVTFTSEIFTNIELSDTDVSVVDETGAILGYMNDDGINGDETADDGIYTLKKTFKADAVGNTLYHVAAKDVVSETINIGYYREYTNEDFDIANAVVSNLRVVSQPFINDDYTVDVEKVEDLMNAISLCLDEEKNNGTVAEYSINFNTVKIALSEGYLFNYSVEVAGVSAGGTQVYVASYAPFDSIRRNPEEEALYDSALDGTAENIGNTFEKYAFNGNYNLNDVTLDSLKHISDYKVVIWGGHGGYDSNIGGYGSSLMTGQLVDADTSIEYSDDISSERILDNFTASGRNTYCVTGGFFEKYLGNMDNALVYLSACHSGQDMIDGISHKYRLAQSFINKGAKAVVGNSESILSVYTYEMERDTLNRMCAKSDDVYYTLSEALDYAKSQNGQNDGTSRRARPIIFPQNDQNALDYRLEETTTGSISGKVMSADDSVAIDNALVRIYQNNRVVKSVRTDEQGNYNIDLPAGEYIVKITAGSYKSAKMAVTVVEDTVTYNETFLLVQVGDEIGYANGTITNALNAQAVPNVTVKVRSSWNNHTGSVIYTATTNDVGYYEIEYTPGLYTIEFSKDGFITGYKNIVVGVLGLFAQNAIISPVMSDEEGEYRVVLSWRDSPNDLDSHLTGPLENSEERFHLYFPLADTMGASENPYREYATLDWDNTRITYNSDPETVTIHKQIDGVYRYSVHDYSNSGNASSTAMANSNAKVDVYKGSVLIGTYHVPNIAGTIWTVFELSGDTFTPINRVGNGGTSNITLYSLRGGLSSTENMTAYDESIIVSDIVEKD